MPYWTVSISTSKRSFLWRFTNWFAWKPSSGKLTTEILTLLECVRGRFQDRMWNEFGLCRFPFVLIIQWPNDVEACYTQEGRNNHIYCVSYVDVIRHEKSLSVSNLPGFVGMCAKPSLDERSFHGWSCLKCCNFQYFFKHRILFQLRTFLTIKAFFVLKVALPRLISGTSCSNLFFLA